MGTIYKIVFAAPEDNPEEVRQKLEDLGYVVVEIVAQELKHADQKRMVLAAEGDDGS